MDIQDKAESTQTLTVATRRGIDIEPLPAYERLMSLDDDGG